MPYTSDDIPWLGTPTSQEAAESVSQDAPALRTFLLREIHQRTKPGLTEATLGLTCDEAEQLFRLNHQTASPRFTELSRDGQIVDSGLRRLTRSKRRATVWITPTICR